MNVFADDFRIFEFACLSNPIRPTMKSFKSSKLGRKSFMADPRNIPQDPAGGRCPGRELSTIKRWVDAGSIEATRTMGKHRLVLLSSALEFARRERIPGRPPRWRLAGEARRPSGDRPSGAIEACWSTPLKAGPGRARPSALIASAYRAEPGRGGAGRPADPAGHGADRPRLDGRAPGTSTRSTRRPRSSSRP